MVTVRPSLSVERNPPICSRARLAAAGVSHKKDDQQGVNCAFHIPSVDVPKKTTKYAHIFRTDKMINKESRSNVIDC